MSFKPCFTAERLENVQIYVGATNKLYKQAAYLPGTAGSVLNVSLPFVFRGRWVMITRNITTQLVLTMCEVQVMGRYFDIYELYSGNALYLSYHKKSLSFVKSMTCCFSLFYIISGFPFLCSKMRDVSKYKVYL